jgi:hypothetical protein
MRRGFFAKRKCVRYSFSVVAEDESELSSLMRQVHGQQAFEALSECTERLFRPARKHGYGEFRLRQFIEDCSEEEAEKILEFVGLLEEEFRAILRDTGASAVEN